jgi:hypothetical protein
MGERGRNREITKRNAAAENVEQRVRGTPIGNVFIGMPVMTDLVGSGRVRRHPHHRGFGAFSTLRVTDREFRVANVTLAAHWTRRRALTPTQHAPPRAGLRLHLLHCSNYRFLFFAKITFQLSL